MMLLWLGCAPPPVAEDQDRDGIPFPADCDDADPAASECDAPAFLDLATGADITCAIRGTGELVCWGEPQYDQAPVDPPSGTFRSISAWYLSYCAVRDDFSVACWGDPGFPIPGPDPDLRAGRVDVGYRHSCALGVGGDLSCWGRCEYDCPPPDQGPFESLDLGASETCGVALGGGSVSCWGQYATPLPEGDWRQVSVGEQIICGVATDGKLACVGEARMVDKTPSGEFVAVTASSENVCAIRPDRTATCWGSNWAEQADPPQDVRFAKIAVGVSFVCGLTLEGDIVCWGDGNYGQLDVPS